MLVVNYRFALLFFESRLKSRPPLINKPEATTTVGTKVASHPRLSYPRILSGVAIKTFIVPPIAKNWFFASKKVSVLIDEMFLRTWEFCLVIMNIAKVKNETLTRLIFFISLVANWLKKYSRTQKLVKITKIFASCRAENTIATEMIHPRVSKRSFRRFSFRCLMKQYI